MTYVIWYLTLSFLLTPLIARFCSMNTIATKELIIVSSKELETAKQNGDPDSVDRLQTYIRSLQQELT